MGIIGNILIIAIVILLSMQFMKSFKLPIRIFLSILLNCFFGIGAYCINMYTIMILELYGNTTNGMAFLASLMFNCMIAMFIFAPIQASIINRYNLAKITKLKFILYTVLLIIGFILFNIIL